MAASTPGFLLVHGAWHGGWCWKDLLAALERHGLSASAPDLPGHGARQSETATWAGYVDAVVQAAGTFATPPIVVGHSMGGAVITSAAELSPAAFDALVYVAAFLPVAGETMGGLAAEGGPPPPGGAFDPATQSVGFTPEAAASLFYHDCAEPLVWAAQVQPQLLAPTVEPISRSDDRFGALPRYAVRCLKDRAIPLDFQTRMLDRTPALETFDIDTGHSPFAADPEGLALILKAVAQARSA